MSLMNEAERGVIMAAELRALKDRVAELETLLGTVREHERREEGSRIRRELLAEFGPNRRITNVIGQKRVLVVVLDRLIPEAG